jgi:hypothetical protein
MQTVTFVGHRSLDRPKQPLEVRFDCFRYGLVTGRWPEHLPEWQLSEFLRDRTRPTTVIPRHRGRASDRVALTDAGPAANNTKPSRGIQAGKVRCLALK